MKLHQLICHLWINLLTGESPILGLGKTRLGANLFDLSGLPRHYIAPK